MLTIFFSLYIDFKTHLHHGIWQHVTFTLLFCWMSLYHGQILIETETDSLQKKSSLLDSLDIVKSLQLIHSNRLNHGLRSLFSSTPAVSAKTYLKTMEQVVLLN